jgi:hypothetical protein
MTDGTSTVSYVYSFGAPWFSHALIDLQKITQLPPNWDSYGSPPLSEYLYRNALRFLSIFKDEDMPEPAIVPISGGGVQFEWYYEDRELEIEFSSITEIVYLKEFENGSMEEGAIGMNDTISLQKVMDWLVTGK